MRLGNSQKAGVTTSQLLPSLEMVHFSTEQLSPISLAPPRPVRPARSGTSSPDGNLPTTLPSRGGCRACSSRLSTEHVSQSTLHTPASLPTMDGLPDSRMLRHAELDLPPANVLGMCTALDHSFLEHCMCLTPPDLRPDCMPCMWQSEQGVSSQKSQSCRTLTGPLSGHTKAAGNPAQKELMLGDASADTKR